MKQKQILTLSISSTYNRKTRKLTNTFTLSDQPISYFSMKYNFIYNKFIKNWRNTLFQETKNKSLYKPFKLVFNTNQEITQVFTVDPNVILYEDLEMGIEFYETQHNIELRKINEQFYRTDTNSHYKYNYFTTIPKDPPTITKVTLDKDNSNNYNLKIIFNRNKNDTKAKNLKYTLKDKTYFYEFTADTIDFAKNKTVTHKFINIKPKNPKKNVDLTFVIGTYEYKVNIPKNYLDYEHFLNYNARTETYNINKSLILPKEQNLIIASNQIMNITGNAILSLEGKITNNGILNTTGRGRIYGMDDKVSLINNNTINFKNDQYLDFTLENNKTINIDSADIYIESTGTLANNKDIIIDSKQDTKSYIYNYGVFRNKGTIKRKNANSFINFQFDNYGKFYYTSQNKSSIEEYLKNYKDETYNSTYEKIPEKPNTNTKIGKSALDNYNKNKANHNTAIGFESLNKMKQGNYNTALGSQTMINSNGNNIIKSNTAIGYKSLEDVKGGFNLAVGSNSGNNIIGGEGNILIGNKSNSSNQKSSNEIVIGNDAKGVKNSVVIGNSNITSIEPGNNNTTLGTKLNKFSTTFISEISNGQVTIKLPNKKLEAGMLMLDANGNLTSGNLENEIKANSSKGNIIFIEVNKGNINGINNNPNVFYKFTAYAYNELTNKKGDLLKNWNGKLDVSKTYVFGRKENTEEHPFYMSDVGYKKKYDKVSIKNIVGKGMNFNNGITGKQRIELKFNSKFNAHDKLYYYCTKHRKMIGEFELFSSDWYKLIVTPRPGLEPGTNLTIKSIDRDKNGNPLKGNQYIFDKNNKNNKAIGKNIVYELALDRKVPEGKSVTLEYKTLDNQGSAVVGKDFKSTQGKVIFTTGTDPKTGIKDGKGKFQDIVVPILDDAVYEDDKEVRMRFKDNNKVITNSDKGYIYSNAKIQDFDTNPVNERYELTVDNPSAVEGKILKYTLTLNKKAASDILVEYAVVKTESTLNIDRYKLPYDKGSLIVKIPKGKKQAELKIQTIDDKIYQGKNKKLVLQFTSYFFNIKNKPTVKVRATGTVSDNDVNPADETYNIIRISEPEKSNAPNAAEGSPLFVQLELDKPVLTDIVVYVITEDGTAKAGTHYEALKDKKIIFEKGKKQKTFEIKTYSDNKYTGQSKKFKIKITGNNLKGISSFGTIPKLTWTKECIINEGDTNPLEKRYYLVAQKSPEIDESDSGTQDLKFVVKLANNERANRDITINYKTLDNYNDKERATAGDYNSEETDYIPAKGTLTINQGNKTGAVYVKVKGDTNYEDNEYVYLEFSPVDDTIDTISNTLLMFGYIKDNDINPDDYIYRNITSWGSIKENVKIVPKVTESNTKMKYIVNLGEIARSNVIINYKTVDGTAKADKDYVSTSGQLIFEQGKQESKEFEITINNDSDFEIEEKLYVEFSGPNIDTFKIQGIIKPDEDKDPNEEKPDLTIKGTKYNHDTGELSIKLNNEGDRDVEINYPQINSLFEATTNSSNRKNGTPEIKIGNTTYYVSKNDITYLDIENQNFDTYFNESYGKNIKSTKGNTYEIIPSYDVANHNYYSITNNPGLKAGDNIEFKIKASFKKNTTYIFMADDIKYNDVKESNENNNYFVFTPEKTITYNDPNSNDSGNDSGSGSGVNTNNEYPTISGYSMVEKAESIYISKYGSGNNSWIDVYLEHYPPPNYQPAILQIGKKDEDGNPLVSPDDLKKKWKLVVKDGDEFITFAIKDYNDGVQERSVNRNDYYYYFGVDPVYEVSSPVVDTYWYKKN